VLKRINILYKRTTGYTQKNLYSLRIFGPALQDMNELKIHHPPFLSCIESINITELFIEAEIYYQTNNFWWMSSPLFILKKAKNCNINSILRTLLSFKLRPMLEGKLKT